MSSQRVHPAEFQVHYLGSSADLAALRRTMEARGVVSRSRLTPTVAAVIADATVPLDHPTLVAARELGVTVYAPEHAIDRLLAAPVPQPRLVPLPVASTPLIGFMVLVLVVMLALLGYFGAVAYSGIPTHTTSVEQADQP